MWLYFGLLAFSTRPKEKPHDEIPPVRMTYTGGTGGDHGGGCIPEAYQHSCDLGCGSCVQTSSCDGDCNHGCNGGSGRRRRFLAKGKGGGMGRREAAQGTEEHEGEGEDDPDDRQGEGIGDRIKAAAEVLKRREGIFDAAIEDVGAQEGSEEELADDL